jgi:hypothetical protein
VFRPHQSGVDNPDRHIMCRRESYGAAQVDGVGNPQRRPTYDCKTSAKERNPTPYISRHMTERAMVIAGKKGGRTRFEKTITVHHGERCLCGSASNRFSAGIARFQRLLYKSANVIILLMGLGHHGRMTWFQRGHHVRNCTCHPQSTRPGSKLYPSRTGANPCKAG